MVYGGLCMRTKGFIGLNQPESSTQSFVREESILHCMHSPFERWISSVGSLFIPHQFDHNIK